MKRRKAIQGIILFSLGTGYLFSCKDKYQVVRDLGLKHFAPKIEELELLELLSQIILPLRNIPQFENHTSLPFIFKMLDEVYSPAERQLFQKVYQDFDVRIEKVFGKGFYTMKEAEQVEMIHSIGEKANEVDDLLKTFFALLKELNVKYLSTSEYYHRKVNYYEMEPGRFKGDVLLSELQNRNQL